MKSSSTFEITPTNSHCATTITLAHYVTSTEPNDQGHWNVTWDQNGESHQQKFAGLMIANGQLFQPNMPEIEGSFAGKLLHSCQYKSPDIFNDQRVLIVGCGNSACDIAVDAAHRAKSVALSVRRGYHFLPKFVMGKPIDTIGGKIQLPRRLKQIVDGLIVKLLIGSPSQYGLPDPDYRLYESHPVLSSLVLHHIGHGDIKVRKSPVRFDGQSVEFADGIREEFDVVVLATGYELSFPFIDRELLNWHGPAPSFYMNVFHPQRDDLFLLGMVEAAGLGWQARADQAEMVALYLLAKDKAPEALGPITECIRKNHDMTGGMNYLKVDRMAYYVHKETYWNELKRHVKQLRREMRGFLGATT